MKKRAPEIPPPRKRKARVPHVNSTLIVGGLCLVCLLAAAFALITSPKARFDGCFYVYNQFTAAENVLETDYYGFLPINIHEWITARIRKMREHGAKHCPKEIVDPPPPKQPANLEEAITEYFLKYFE